MEQHDDKVKLFGHHYTWQELFTITLLLAALIAAIAGIIGNNAILYMSSILFLLSTFVLYMFFFMRQAETKLNNLSNSIGKVITVEEKLDTLIHNQNTAIKSDEKIEVLLKALDATNKYELLVNPEDIFLYGIRAIENSMASSGWDKVRIYAPVGLWDTSRVKDQWLEKVQTSLGDQQANAIGYVKAFRAVYGLPSSRESYFAYAKRRLELFKNTKDTQIHYLPPEDQEHPCHAPGIGAIIFENRSDQRYEVVFAFVNNVTENTFLRSGFVIKDKEIGRLLADWFDEQAFGDASQNFVLRGRDPKDHDRKKWVDFDAQLAEIEKRYYQPQVDQSTGLKLVQ